jgi:hypothetical protein
MSIVRTYQYPYYQHAPSANTVLHASHHANDFRVIVVIVVVIVVMHKDFRVILTGVALYQYNEWFIGMVTNKAIMGSFYQFAHMVSAN